MSSNYSRPTSPGASRKKPDRSGSYHGEGEGGQFGIQQRTSPPRQHGTQPLPLPEQPPRRTGSGYGPVHLQRARYYYSPQDAYRPQSDEELDPERKIKSFSDPLARDTRGEPREPREPADYRTPEPHSSHSSHSSFGVQQQDVPGANKVPPPQSLPVPEPSAPWRVQRAPVPHQDQFHSRIMSQPQSYYQQPMLGMASHHHVQPPWALAPSMRAEQQQPILQPLGGPPWRHDDMHMMPAYDPGVHSYYSPAGPTAGSGPHLRVPGHHQQQHHHQHHQQHIPQLVRTRALAQQTSGRSLSGYGGFEPIQGVAAPARQPAHLSIDGDLKTVTVDWPDEDKASCRRLVLFERGQNGSTIVLKFRPIAREQYDSQTTVISCIYWKERKEFYLTSVDCISLLELIINQKFSVEEKNRVRRNLEVCKPLTISKTKAESESFFQLIMKFEPPRPRNIEKDLKVFPWNQLEQALQKIVAKYSADYAGG